MYRKRRHNKNCFRLLKQFEDSKLDCREHGVKPLRLRSYYKQTYDMIWYDYPDSSKPQRSWKSFRKTQYK